MKWWDDFKQGWDNAMKGRPRNWRPPILGKPQQPQPQPVTTKQPPALRHKPEK